MKEQDSIVEAFLKMSKESGMILEQRLEVNVEPYFEKALLFVQSHPEKRDEFIQTFIQIAHDPALGPFELIGYCMHALRWPELKNYFSEWLASERSERVRYVLRKIVWSFNDDWWDADMYVRFNKDK